MAGKLDGRMRAGAAALAGVAMLAGPALAQESANCGTLATDVERIACLEARVQALEEALSRTGAAPAAPTPVESSPQPAQEATDAALPAPPEPSAAAASSVEAAAETASAPVASEPERRRRRLGLSSLPFFGDDEEDDAAPALSSVAAAPAPAPAAVDPEAFGAEQVAARTGSGDERRDAEQEILRARIVDFVELHRGRLVVTLDNGQMWRQLDVDSRKVRLEEGEPVDVEIRRSGFGGYRMKIGDNRRILSVERIR